MKFEKNQLSQDRLEWVISESSFIESAFYYEEIDSTNKKAKELAKEGYDAGLLIVAEYQTNGKGRLARVWDMPKGKDLMFTLLLKPTISILEVSKLTMVMAQAIVRVLRKKYDKEFKIKWPNDIIYNGKKLCGILTEMSSRQNNINYLVIGVGLNCNTESFTKDIKNKAISLISIVDEEVNRGELLKAVIEEYEILYADFLVNGLKNLLKEINETSALIGEEIYIIKENVKVKVKVTNISIEGELSVVYEDGKIDKVISGEVSISGVY